MLAVLKLTFYPSSMITYKLQNYFALESSSIIWRKTQYERLLYWVHLQFITVQRKTSLFMKHRHHPSFFVLCNDGLFFIDDREVSLTVIFKMLKNKKNNKRKSSKSRNKRIITIYSSQNSILQAAPKGTSLPLKKINKSSVTNLNVRPKQAPKKQKQRHHTISMKNRPPQTYQKIPMYFVNSNTNSEIQFSNYGETRKDVNKPFKKTLYIDCDQQALIKQIWRQDKRKDNIQHKAAIKIQKVFRGYLTRKLLMKYIEAYQEKLLMEKQMLERQMKMKHEHPQDFIQDASGSKLAYYPTNKAAISQYQWQIQEKENPLDMQSSIMVASIDNGHSLQEEEPNTYDRRQIQAERESFTLNQSMIARQQEISMSFGQDNQHSPHFHPAPKRRNSKEISRSPTQNKCTHYISQDKTGDGFSQNMSSCPSYAKPYKHHQKEQSSRMSSLMREEAEEITERQSIHLQHLRSTEKAKWQQVIQLVNDQMKEGINQERTRELMSFILEFSVKNREQLNKQSSFQVTPTTVTKRQDQPEHIRQNEKNISFKKKKWKDTEEIEKIKKNQNLPLSRKQKQDKTILERTSNMKQYLIKNINVQDEQIDKLMYLRQAVLRKKQSNSLIQLNSLLENNELSQDDFIERMSTLTTTFLKQKKDIEQTKDEIYQGYRAQIQLFKSTIMDAKYLGYNIPFCRSMEIYPSCPKWRFDEVMIDQLNQLAQRRTQTKMKLVSQQVYRPPPELSTRKIDEMLEDKSRFKEEPQRQVFNESESEDQANFSYEETDIYNNCAPYSGGIRQMDANEFVMSPKNMKKINDFNRYSTIALNEDPMIDPTERSLNTSQQKLPKKQEDEEQQYISLRRMPKKETFKIQYSSDEEQQEVAIYQESNDRQIEDSVTFCFNKLVYDFIQDIFKTPKFIQSLHFHKNKQRKLMQPITKQEKLQFLQSTVLMLPKFDEIKPRLNQKMYPNTRQLLISMRQELQGADSEHEYYEIGHYEYILNQQICYDSIETFIEAYRAKKQQTQSKRQNLQEESLLSQIQKYSPSGKLMKYVQNYRLASKIKQQQTEELREQVLKIELHLVLDAWNELLIKHRENKLGYSGIGLNQITFSLVDRVCRPMTKESQWNDMITATKGQIQETIRNDVLHEKLIKEYEQFVSQNDSQWILYAQEGLQYGFDLTKAVQVELIFELLEELHHLNEVRTSQQTQIEVKHEEKEEMQAQDGQDDDDDASECSSEHLNLNEDQQHQLEKKIQNMNNYSDSDDSFDQ